MNTRLGFLICVFSTILYFLPGVVNAETNCKGFSSPGNPFACGTYGNCTWWVVYKRADLKGYVIRSPVDPSYGNWYEIAGKLGFPVGQKSVTGAVAVFSNGPNGHVAYVERAYADGTFDASEMDFYGSLGTGDGVQYATYRPSSGRYSRNDGGANWNLIGFIYPKGMTETENFCDPTKRKCTLSVYGNIGWFPAIPVCQQATQWFNLAVVNGEKVAVGSTVVANCPMVCVAH